ncbi:MAG: energy-coupling factor transporter ATPase [Clostridiales Family XIII bacterium]|nr:energy-coupling factor transporter ATPase [Clostridiales Family XIII bacterium]
MGKDIIVLDALTYEYRKEDEEQPVKALDGVSLSVAEGSFTAVLGKNGSGKSTLAKNINALLLPSGGAVYVDGFNTADEAHVWEIRQRAGMVFQNPDNQLVSAIVEDDVAFGPENLGVATEEIKLRIERSLKSVGMYEFRKKGPHMLSGGQKQRVAIAGVIAMRPKCVIFDEPTAMLDPKGREEVMDVIRMLHGEGVTIVLITHFMEEAVHADRVVILDDGRVALDGTPEEVFLEMEAIREMALDAPLVVELADRLRRRGWDVPPVIKMEEMVEYLCR